MRTILLLIIITSFCYGCKKARGCTPEKYQFTFEQSKQMDTVRVTGDDERFTYYSYQIKEGDNLLFKYYHQFESCPDLIDDGGARTILFEVPVTATSFRIEDSAALQRAKTLLVPSCGECVLNRPVLFKKGFVEGTKINNDKWRITAELKAPWSADYTISFDKDFLKR